MWRWRWEKVWPVLREEDGLERERRAGGKRETEGRGDIGKRLGGRGEKGGW